MKSESEVAQSCPTLSDPMDCSLPGSSVRGIFQARVLEWGAIAFSKQKARPLNIVTCLIRKSIQLFSAKGYTEGWINQRLQTIEMRKELTDEWKARGIEKETDYAILTNEMTKAWSGLTVKEYKQKKDLKKRICGTT